MDCTGYAIARCRKEGVFACVHDGWVGAKINWRKCYGEWDEVTMEVVVMSQICSYLMCLCGSSVMGHEALYAAYC